MALVSQIILLSMLFKFNFLKGNQHNLSVVFCHCEPEAVTLIRYNLWPATPSSPIQAFHFDLLDWLEALLLECQVAVKDFVHALELRRPWYSILSQSQVIMYNTYSIS